MVTSANAKANSSVKQGISLSCKRTLSESLACGGRDEDCDGSMHLYALCRALLFGFPTQVERHGVW